MTRAMLKLVVAVLLVVGQVPAAAADGLKGRGGARPAGGARPNISRGSTPSLGGSRPAPASRPSAANRPAPTSRPNFGPGTVGRPQPSQPNLTRPNISRPDVSRPSGGLKPTPNRPGNFPQPGTRPSLPSTNNRPGIQRPTTQPGGTNKLPGRPPTSIPNLGNQLPSRPSVTLPNNQRPGVQLPGTRPTMPERPTVRPPAIDRPTTRPITRPETLPGTRPSLPGNVRPTLPTQPNRPSRPTMPSRPQPGARPLPGDVNDFLGIQRPPKLPGDLVNRPGITKPGTERPSIERPSIERPSIERPSIERPSIERPKPGTRPERPSTLPGINRPGINRPGEGDRPGGGDRPGINRPERPTTLPGEIGGRPGLGNRPGGGDRPGGITRPERPTTLPEWVQRPNRPGGDNDNIHKLPDWVGNRNPGQINNRWQNALQRPGYDRWLERNPSRFARWNFWGSNVRFRWSYHHRHFNWFGPTWWSQHYHPCGGWHYHYYYNNYRPSFWWSRPTFLSLNQWFTWAAPQTVWSEPIYYDYGQGGNVYYQDNTVYFNGQPLGSADDYAASAAALATVEPPASEDEAAAAEWMPLGTFAVSSSDSEQMPTRSVQLAVNKQGVVSGTLFNETTETAQTLLGQVDKETQRVALRIGESDDVIMETGLYNLTQDECPVMVHFGPDKVEYWLLVRLEYPEELDGAE